MKSYISPCELQVCAYGVEAFEDLVARDLDLVDEQVVAVVVDGQVVEGGHKHRHQDLEHVLERRARLQVGAAQVGVPGRKRRARRVSAQLGRVTGKRQ